MSVHIVFDKGNKYFTNLDFVTGRVVLYLHHDATISAITVKLEAESRSRLQGPKYDDDKSDKKRTEVEVHKLLYKVQTVFPSPELQGTNKSQFPLAAGQYEYPFQFKIPFNNDCMTNNKTIKDMKLGQLNAQIGPDLNRHIKKTLPPTLSGFPGEAEIKYYVKATVVRPKFYQENFRYQIDIRFLPIEPPRPLDRQEETYARRKQQFQKQANKQEKKRLLRKSSVPASNAEEDQLEVQVDARLPNPAIVTCNAPLPLRILVHKLSGSSQDLVLGMLQIELIGYTKVRAHDLTREETTPWLLMSQANMNLPLQRSPNKETDEWLVPPHLWSNIPLPNTVAPSFSTCNITRQYELEVRVGLLQGNVSGSRPELMVLPLRLPVTIYSGIAPPQQLLVRMNQPQPQVDMESVNPIIFERPIPVTTMSSITTTPSTPTSNDFDPSPAPMGSYHPEALEDYPEEAPPSYEDAMADDLAPVDGPRPGEYNVPSDDSSRTDSGYSFESDSKSGLVRRVSERLFSSNAPMSPSARRTSSYNPTSSPIREDGVDTRYSEDELENEQRPALPLRTRSGQEKA